jgi:hypothetical protein
MPNTGMYWTKGEIEELKQAWNNKPEYMTKRDFSRNYESKHSMDAVKGCIDRLITLGELEKQYIKPSPYPVYNEPLVMQGDALILPDLEIPFHNSEFVNRVLGLAEAWGIRQCILAGDVLHFDSLSGWEPNWTKTKKGGITAKAEGELMEEIDKLPEKYRRPLAEKIIDIGERTEEDGVSTELDIASRELKKLSELFDKIDFVLGNHCGRLLRAMQTAINPKLILKMLEAGDKWRIAEYYFSKLETVNGTFIIEHPKNSGKFSASRLCSKYMAHVLMGHSHQLNYTFDPSGKFYAVEMGCCVDEQRLPYASQRHNTSPMHVLGAVIVLDGYPYLLHEGTDWERMRRINGR